MRSNTTQIKKMALAYGWFKNECATCGLGPEWNGKPLTLQLDHIDGNRTNDRKENLRLLCPNCHTQTPTYGGKSNKDKKLLDLTCSGCGKEFKRFLTEEFQRRDRKDGPFCSKSCSSKANGAKGLMNRYGLQEVKLAPPVQLRCVVCAKSFSRKRASETFKSKKRKSGPFCSSDCWNRYQTTRKSQKFTPFLDLS